VVLGVSIAFLVRLGLDRGFRPFEVSVLAAAWLMPLLARTLAGAGLPLALGVMLLLYTVILWRAASELRLGPGWRGRYAVTRSSPPAAA
jgi:hypothetical protein